MLKIVFRIIRHICGECGRFHPYVDDPRFGACKLRGEPRMPKIITVREDVECVRERQSKSVRHKSRYFIPRSSKELFLKMQVITNQPINYLKEN